MGALRQLPREQADRLLETIQEPLFAYLMRVTGHPADAKDLQQQTNLVIWEKWEQVAPEKNVLAWAKKIALNLSRNHYRKEGNRRTLPLLDDDLAVLVERRAEEREKEWVRKRKLLHFCLERLPARQKEVVEAHYMRQEELTDIATTWSRSRNAVHQLLFRARQTLIACVQQQSLGVE